MKIRRTDDLDITYWEHDNSELRFAYNVKEFRVDTRDRKFILIPIGWDGSEGPAIDATEMYEKFCREQQ